MTTIAPMKSSRRGFVEIPKKEYDAFLLWRNETAVPLPKKKVKATIKVRAKTKPKAKKLPAGLRQALREVKEGKVVGPFNSVEELMADLLS